MHVEHFLCQPARAHLHPRESSQKHATTAPEQDWECWADSSSTLSALDGREIFLLRCEFPESTNQQMSEKPSFFGRGRLSLSES